MPEVKRNIVGTLEQPRDLIEAGAQDTALTHAIEAAAEALASALRRGNTC